jgi:hypothetical protein
LITASGGLIIPSGKTLTNTGGISGQGSIATSGGLTVSAGSTLIGPAPSNTYTSKLTICETTGTGPYTQNTIGVNPPSSNNGTNGSLVITHNNAGGYSSILFPSTQNAGSDYAYIQYFDNTSNSSGQECGLLLIGIENDTGQANSNPSDVMALYCAGGNGNIGINTMTPTCALDISGTVITNGNITVGGNITSAGLITASGGLTVSAGTASLQSGLSITGKLTFDNNTGEKISLWNSAANYGFGIQSSLLQIYCGTGARVGIGSGSTGSFTETLTVNGSNVGIGKTNPSTALDVNGVINTNGNLTVGGNIVSTGLITASGGLIIPSGKTLTNAGGISGAGSIATSGGFTGNTMYLSGGLTGSSAQFTGTVTAPTFSGTATNATNATNVVLTSDNTSGTYYIPFSKSAAGTNPLYVDDTTGPLTYNPLTATITAGSIATTNNLTVSGSIIGPVSFYQPNLSTTTNGGMFMLSKSYSGGTWTTLNTLAVKTSAQYGCAYVEFIYGGTINGSGAFNFKIECSISPNNTSTPNVYQGSNTAISSGSNFAQTNIGGGTATTLKCNIANSTVTFQINVSPTNASYNIGCFARIMCCGDSSSGLYYAYFS